VPRSCLRQFFSYPQINVFSLTPGNCRCKLPPTFFSWPTMIDFQCVIPCSLQPIIICYCFSQMAAHGSVGQQLMLSPIKWHVEHFNSRASDREYMEITEMWLPMIKIVVLQLMMMSMLLLPMMMMMTTMMTMMTLLHLSSKSHTRQKDKPLCSDT